MLFCDSEVFQREHTVGHCAGHRFKTFPFWMLPQTSKELRKYLSKRHCFIRSIDIGVVIIVGNLSRSTLETTLETVLEVITAPSSSAAAVLALSLFSKET